MWIVTECGVGRGKFRERLRTEAGYGHGVELQLFEAEVSSNNVQEVRKLADLAVLTHGLNDIFVEDVLTLCQLVAALCDLGRVTDEPALLFRWGQDPLFSPLVGGVKGAFCTVVSREGKFYFFRHLLDLSDWTLKSTEMHGIKTIGQD